MTTRWARRTATAAVVACGLLVAGCGGADEQATIDWTNGLCGSYATFREAALVGPAPATDPEGQARSLATYLGDTASALDTSLADLDGLGASPVEGGDQAVTKFRDQLTRYRDAFRQAHTQVQGLDLDSRTLPRDMEGAVAPVLALQDTDQDPLAGLDSAVTNAAAKAPACQDLSRLSGG
ncbi:hypothetical protein [Pseudonocardia sp. WMMC193]|uniref:hypothetical protein n=1 Tax=Pseudonocardia sp. WMMC193 TaxID=2911965 RepID=UPI001F3FF723|nr:hypothetical protein [Pseudonocardia sp. WMMC193]MCF7551627.1 hypothetical protein [Pseudonocardia sp. WMMC193]